MTPKKANRGVIYILANKYMPEVLKIGRTARDVDTRVRELSRPTGVPTDFEVIYDELVSDVNAAEKRVHDLLSDRRVNEIKRVFQDRDSRSNKDCAGCKQ